MNKKINGVFTYRVFTYLALALVSVFSISVFQLSAFSQTQSPLYTGLQNAFDVHNTNSLIAADEINLTPVYKWSGDKQRSGGGIIADWWVTDQQGAFLGFDEFTDRKSYFSVGYQARTVFKSVEFGLGIGTRQDNDDPFGDVQLFLRPAASIRLVKLKDFDLRLKLGADIVNTGKPSPFIGVTLTAFRF